MEELKVKPLTSDDVNTIRQDLLKLDNVFMTKMTSEYYNCIRSIIVRLSSQVTDDDDLASLLQLQRIFNFAPADEIFIRTYEKVWAVKHHLIKRNAKYFLEKDYSFLVKKDGNENFIISLIEILRDQYEQMLPEEKSFYWKKGLQIVKYIATFKKKIKEINSH